MYFLLWKNENETFTWFKLTSNVLCERYIRRWSGLICIHLVWFLKLTQLRYIVLKTYWTAFASHGMIECICTWEYCWHKVVRRIFLLNRDFVCRPRWKQISKQNHWWIEEPETKNLSTSMDQGHCDDGIQ